MYYCTRYVVFDREDYGLTQDFGIDDFFNPSFEENQLMRTEAILCTGGNID
jgi:hypothetical protein